MNRIKFPLPQPQPTTPVRGIAVTPVVFQSPAMQRLARAARAKAGSRWAVIKPKRASRAILWEGRPFYWTSKGFYRAGTGDRRPLQHLLWEKRSRRKMPPQHEIFFRDRDRHNFSESNLELLSKAAMHLRIVEIGENKQISPEQRQQMANRRWERHGKKQTGLLLQKFNRGEGQTFATQLKEKQR
jgi:hypothetical protein